MAIQVEEAVREFHYNGTSLGDPGKGMSVQQVRDLYSATFPELTSAVVEGPTRKGNRLIYEFRRAAGTKG
ncbi:PRTRC system protein C [Aromatoleum aromaticum]|jgi:PRTRC genetic system protein C|uniref:PRTRC system protein C n=1 Tax=Aromatoleum aromaticum TaxID=551760 RepID=UPI000A05E804|nr:PRTRC system protein C [Aromatoleum aromaticum]